MRLGNCAAFALVLLALGPPAVAGKALRDCQGARVDIAGTGAACLQPGDPASREFKDCFETKSGRVCGPVMVVVPSGRFLMGSPRSEPGHAPEERGEHRKQVPVEIAEPFAIGKFEITFAQWDGCATCHHKPDDSHWGRGQRPVIDVSWEDAVAYVRWLSKAAKRQYRLASEVEWEYAARAGTATPFSTGMTITADQANFRGSLAYPGAPKGIDRNRTTEVGSFPANAFGLHDMHGNVWEWVQDCQKNWLGKLTVPHRRYRSSCRLRAIRGGAWIFDPFYARSASRNWYPQDFRSNSGGFRVVREVLVADPS